MTAAEVEEVMGPDLGPLFYALYNEVAWVHATFHEYRQLYGTSKQRVDLLNETAPFFFLVLEGVLWRDILMHINRLTDPPEHAPNLLESKARSAPCHALLRLDGPSGRAYPRRLGIPEDARCPSR